MRALQLLLAALAAFPSAILACAESDATTSGEDAGDTSPPTSPEDAADASKQFDADEPCDGGGPACTSMSLPCDATDWCPVDVPGPKHALNAVWGTSPTDVWIVGSAGAIVHWDGSTWVSVPSGTPHTLNAVGGTRHDDVWVVSTPEVMFHTEGYKGATTIWERVKPIATGYVFSSLLRSVWNPPGTDTIVVGGDWNRTASGVERGAALFRTARSPVAWSTLLGSGEFRVRGIWGISIDDVWIVGQPEASWEDVKATALHRVTGVDGGIENWLETDTQSQATLNAIWGSSAADVWAVGQRGTIRHYTGNPPAFQIVQSPTLQDLHAVWGTSPGDVWIVGDGGTLLHWDGSRLQPTSASFPVGQNPALYGIWGSGPNDIWAVGERRTVLHHSGPR